MGDFIFKLAKILNEMQIDKKMSNKKILSYGDYQIEIKLKEQKELKIVPPIESENKLVLLKHY